MKTLFGVKQSVLGKSEKEIYWFETKQEAHDYYNNNQYVGQPFIKNFHEEEAKEMLNFTSLSIAMRMGDIH